MVFFFFCVLTRRLIMETAVEIDPLLEKKILGTKKKSINFMALP